MTGFAKMPGKVVREKEMPEEIKKTTNLKKLVKLAHNNAYFFKDPDSRAFAKIKKGEHREELYPLKSSSFEDWLSAINFKVFEEVATSKLKSDATEFLEGETKLSGTMLASGSWATRNTSKLISVIRTGSQFILPSITGEFESTKTISIETSP